MSNHVIKIICRLLVVIIIVSFGFLISRPATVYAGDKKVLQACDVNKTFDDCDSKLLCIKSQEDWNFISKSICWPKRDYYECGEKGASTVIIHNAKDLAKYTVDCVSSQYVPSDNTTKSECNQSSDCQNGANGSVDKQCFWLNIIGPGTNGNIKSNTPFSVSRCIPVSGVPSVVQDPLDSNTTVGGANCAKTNAKCSDGKVCVDNPYTPGTKTNERYVCYDENKTGTIESCLGKKVGDTCGKNTTGVPLTCMVVAGKNGWDNGVTPCGICADAGFSGTDCQKLLTSKSCQSGLKCVDVTELPYGPSAPSSKTCITNKDCIDPLDKYCIYNPVTKLNQCFRQITTGAVMPSGVYTPLEPTPTSDACAEVGKDSCEKDKPSVCSKYFPEAGKEVKVCINSSALATGAANPVFPKPDVAAERNERYAPILEIPIPGLEFTEKIIGRNAIGGRIFSVPFLAQYLQATYKYSLGLGILVAVVTIMAGGILWMVSFGDQGRIGKAKTMMINSALGLVILFGAYTILYTINPDLAQLKSLQIFAPKQEAVSFAEGQDVPPPETQQDGGGGEADRPSRICKTKETCAPYCSKSTPLPAAAPGMAAPNQLIDVQNWFAKNSSAHTGLTINKGALLKENVLPILKKAGELAAQKGYVIRVQSTYRTLADQMNKYCAHLSAPDYIKDNPKNPYNPATLAWPGGSNHGVGVAIDVSLLKNGTAVAGYARKSEHGQPYSDLKEIMFTAGFVRLKSEEWHYEYWGSAAPPGGRCKC